MATRVTRATSKERSATTQPAQPTGSVDNQPHPEGDSAQPTELTLADIQQSITSSSTKVCGKLDALTLDVATIKTKLADLEGSVTMNTNKLMDIENDKLPKMEKKLKEKISTLEDKLTSMEIHSRRLNLLFYGVAESQNENVEKKLRDTFIFLGIDTEDAARIPIVNVHRLPRRGDTGQASGGDPQTAPTPRAIIAKFVYMRDRDRILTAFDDRYRQRQPRGSNAVPDLSTRRITVRSDLPPALKAKRSSLAKIAYDLRKQKNASTKIYLAGTKILLKWREKGTANWNFYQD